MLYQRTFLQSINFDSFVKKFDHLREQRQKCVQEINQLFEQIDTLKTYNNGQGSSYQPLGAQIRQLIEHQQTQKSEIKDSCKDKLIRDVKVFEGGTIKKQDVNCQQIVKRITVPLTKILFSSVNDSSFKISNSFRALQSNNLGVDQVQISLTVNKFFENFLNTTYNKQNLISVDELVYIHLRHVEVMATLIRKKFEQTHQLKRLSVELALKLKQQWGQWEGEKAKSICTSNIKEEKNKTACEKSKLILQQLEREGEIELLFNSKDKNFSEIIEGIKAQKAYSAEKITYVRYRQFEEVFRNLREPFEQRDEIKTLADQIDKLVPTNKKNNDRKIMLV